MSCSFYPFLYLEDILSFVTVNPFIVITNISDFFFSCLK